MVFKQNTQNTGINDQCVTVDKLFVLFLLIYFICRWTVSNTVHCIRLPYFIMQCNRI